MTFSQYKEGSPIPLITKGQYLNKHYLKMDKLICVIDINALKNVRKE